MPISITSRIGEGDPSFRFNRGFVISMVTIIYGAVEIMVSRLFRNPISV